MKNKKTIRKSLEKWLMWSLVLLMVSCTDQCTKPCGVFQFNDDGILDNASVNGWDMSIDFDFNPADCGEECACNKVCFVQMVRSIDQEDGTYLYISSEAEDRATAEGWYIDRVNNRDWGYYGRNDDGTFANYLTPGSTTTTANLADFPTRGESEPWIDFIWMAITVPVCIDNPTSACNNQLLGYYEWAWHVDAAGTVPWGINWISPKGFKDDFDDAVAAWNTEAPGLGKNNFPAFTRLSE